MNIYKFLGYDELVGEAKGMQWPVEITVIGKNEATARKEVVKIVRRKNYYLKEAWAKEEKINDLQVKAIQLLEKLISNSDKLK